MRFLAILIGFLIVTAGLAWAAIEAGAPQIWVAIGALIMLGLGIVSAASGGAYRGDADVTVVKERDGL